MFIYILFNKAYLTFTMLRSGISTIGFIPWLIMILIVTVIGILIAIPLEKKRKKALQNDPLLIEILKRTSYSNHLPIISIFTTHISVDQEMYLFSTYNHAQVKEYVLYILADWYCEVLSSRGLYEKREILFPAQGYIGHHQGSRYRIHIETFGYIIFPANIAQNIGGYPWYEM